MDDEIHGLFREGVDEQLTDLETGLLRLEENPGEEKEIHRIFRAIHTIKGSAGLVGIDNLADFAHKLENKFDDIRCGRRPVTAELINATLEARDIMAQMVREFYGGEPVAQGAVQAILLRLFPSEEAFPVSQGLSPAREKLSGLVETLNQIKSHPSHHDFFRRITEEIGTIREMCRRNRAENVHEFLLEFETLFSEAGQGEIRIPPDLMATACQAMLQAVVMIQESEGPPDASPLDPVAILDACRRPLEILAELRQKRASLAKAPPRRPAEKTFRIRLWGKDLTDQVVREIIAHLESRGDCELLETVFPLGQNAQANA